MNIEIICTAPSHDDPVIIYRFARGQSGWVSASSWVRSGSPRSGKIAGMDAAGALVDGDRYLGAPASADLTDHWENADLRTRFAFECPKCGFKVTARRDKLDPVLDRLADASVPSISLRGLAVSIRGKHV